MVISGGIRRNVVGISTRISDELFVEFTYYTVRGELNECDHLVRAGSHRLSDRFVLGTHVGCPRRAGDRRISLVPPIRVLLTCQCVKDRPRGFASWVLSDYRNRPFIVRAGDI